MNREQNLKGHKNVICCIFSVVILIVLLFPLYWTLVTSLKTEQEIFQIPPTLWPNVLIRNPIPRSSIMAISICSVLLETAF